VIQNQSKNQTKLELQGKVTVSTHTMGPPNRKQKTTKITKWNSTELGFTLFVVSILILTGEHTAHAENDDDSRLDIASPAPSTITIMISNSTGECSKSQFVIIVQLIYEFQFNELKKNPLEVGFPSCTNFFSERDVKKSCSKIWLCLSKKVNE
jgi:hypothetical protein